MAVSAINNWPVMMPPVRRCTIYQLRCNLFSSSQSDPPLSTSPTQHPSTTLRSVTLSLTDLLITGTNGSDLIRPNGEARLFPCQQPPSPPFRPHLLSRHFPHRCPRLLHRSPLSIRLASMHIHQLSRASWPAQRARHTNTHTCGRVMWKQTGKQTSHSPLVHIMFCDLARV